MKKFSLFAILLGFNIALGACSDDDAAPVVKDQIFQLPEKAYVLAEQSRRAIVIRDAETNRNIWSWIHIRLVFLLPSRVGLSIRAK